MISLLSLRLPKLIGKVLLPLLLLTCICYTIIQSGVDVDDIHHNVIHAIQNTFNTTMFDVKFGHHIERGDVSFSFINSKRKGNTPAEVLKTNQALYDKVLAEPIDEPKDFDLESIRPPEDFSTYRRANATIMALVRNNEIGAMRRTMKQFEKSFNEKFRYPYTFLNDEPFTEQFKEKVRSFTEAECNFVHIPASMWNKPELIDLQKQSKAMTRLEKMNVAYAKKESYHNMCRFYLGSFYNLPEMQKYKYYWRIEPNVQFYTDLKYDVFRYLEGTKKIYGFTINLYDIDESIETLYPETIKFLNQGDNYKYVNENGAFQWITEDQQVPKKARVAQGYSTCHFWSNFEIADMDFFRGEAYTNWFKHLDDTGKFYYERWGDAPVHSLGIALFADKKKVHWFRDIGYHHIPYINCPAGVKTRRCRTGQFSDGGHNMDQNCMATWIDYEMPNFNQIW